MQLHGITVASLAADRPTNPAKIKGSVPARFKNPEMDETWTGHGCAPHWLDGKDKDTYRITN